MTLTASERAALESLTADLRRRFGAVQARLFGSAARDELDDESDIDLFIVVPHLTWPIEQSICYRCCEATLARGRLFSLSVFAEAERVSEQFIKTGIISAHLGRALNQAFDLRQEAD